MTSESKDLSREKKSGIIQRSSVVREKSTKGPGRFQEQQGGHVAEWDDKETEVGWVQRGKGDFEEGCWESAAEAFEILLREGRLSKRSCSRGGLKVLVKEILAIF